MPFLPPNQQHQSTEGRLQLKRSDIVYREKGKKITTPDEDEATGEVISSSGESPSSSDSRSSSPVPVVTLPCIEVAGRNFSSDGRSVSSEPELSGWLFGTTCNVRQTSH